MDIRKLSTIKKKKNKVITKTKYLFLIITFSIFGCRNGNYFNNVCKVEVFGDSLRIETECYGDSIIKHHIDLKGISDDGFDSSFNVTIKREKEKSIPKFECEEKFKFNYRDYEIRYCKEELIKELGKQGWTKRIADSIGVNIQMDSLVGKNNDFILIGYVDQIDYQIIERETNDTIKSILKGSYITEFSGGILYEIIDSKRDTIELFQRNIWMN